MNFGDPPHELPKGAEMHASTPSAATIFGGHVWYTFARATERGANTQYTAVKMYNSKTGRTFASRGKCWCTRLIVRTMMMNNTSRSGSRARRNPAPRARTGPDPDSGLGTVVVAVFTVLPPKAPGDRVQEGRRLSGDRRPESERLSRPASRPAVA